MSQAKHDTGKLRAALVPASIIKAVANVRTFGTQKYGDPENWRTVEVGRYEDALMRHICDWLEDRDGVDTESGMPHLWHAACNIAFILELKQ